jgi:hypothetical protein
LHHNLSAEHAKIALDLFESKFIFNIILICILEINNYMSGGITNILADWVLVIKSILAKAMEVEEIRNELYCQIIKQMTDNGKSDQILKGWELMAFCTGTFAPTQVLLKVTFIVLPETNIFSTWVPIYGMYSETNKILIMNGEHIVYFDYND